MHINKKKKKYTFFSMGTGYAFDPSKSVSAYGQVMNALDFHKQEVKFRNRPDTFIIDDQGKTVKV